MRYAVYLARWPEFADHDTRGKTRCFVVAPEGADPKEQTLVRLDVTDRYSEDLMEDLATKICKYMNAREEAIEKAVADIPLT